MQNPFLNIDAVLAEFKTASDRAAAVVGGAFLDELLTELLRSFLVEDKKSDDRLFKGSGCFATFSARIDVCCRLGLIAKEEHRLLRTIKDIRNRFAHDLGELTFLRQDIRDLCSNAQMPVEMVSPKSIPLPRQGQAPPLPSIEQADAGNPRAIFEETVVTLMHVLAARTALASIARRTEPERLASSVEIARTTLRIFEDVLAKYDEVKDSPLASLMPEMQPSRETCESLVTLQRFFVQQMEVINRGRQGNN